MFLHRKENRAPDWHDYVDTADGRYVSESEADATIRELEEKLKTARKDALAEAEAACLETEPVLCHGGWEQNAVQSLINAANAIRALAAEKGESDETNTANA